MQSPPVKKRRNRKFVKLNVTEELINSLPEGVSYIEPAEQDKKKDVDLSDEDDDESKDGDIVDVGEFRVNLAVVDKDQLINLRKYMPRE